MTLHPRRAFVFRADLMRKISLILAMLMLAGTFSGCI
jgi:hypothetical protein